MQIIERSSKIKEIIKDDDIEEVQYSVNSDMHFCIRIVKQDGKEILITLTAAQTRHLLRFLKMILTGTIIY